MMNVPAHGARVVFDVVPAGSYATAGRTYLVTHYANRKGVVHTVNIENVETGGATQDAPAMYRRASWKVAA